MSATVRDHPFHSYRSSSRFLLSCGATLSHRIAPYRRNTPMPVKELKREVAEQKALSLPAAIAKRLSSVRVSYPVMIAVVCWFAFAIAIYFLRALGFLAPR
jgi:hypothetical protein